jgi:hypothetical protein
VLSRTIREISPPPADPGIEVRVLTDGGGTACEIVARDGDRPRNLLDLQLEVHIDTAGPQTRASAAVRVPVEQVGLGRYRTVLPGAAARHGGCAMARLLLADGAGARELWRGPLSVPASAETAVTGADVRALEALSRAGGGGMLTGTGDVARLAHDTKSAGGREATAELAAAALVLVCIELVLRFVVFRRSG